MHYCPDKTTCKNQFKIDEYHHFTALVREMREAQKSPYYENPSRHYNERIRAEHRVDKWMEENHEN